MNSDLEKSCLKICVKQQALYSRCDGNNESFGSMKGPYASLSICI